MNECNLRVRDWKCRRLFAEKVSVRGRIGKLKSSLLFSESVLGPFRTPIGKYQCHPYLSFLRVFSDIQSGIDSILRVSPSHTDFIDASVFEAFVEKHIHGIQSLARLKNDLSEFKEFYIAIVLARFTFFLCPPPSTTFSLRELVSCSRLSSSSTSTGTA
jgi:hypothetical protein